jgi:hypothetical protein
MAIRLFLYGSAGVENTTEAVVAYFDRKTDSRGVSYKALTDLRRFSSSEEAAAAQVGCRAAGCVLAGENPQVSCVRLEPVRGLKEVFQSETAVTSMGKFHRSAVQVFEVVAR